VSKVEGRATSVEGYCISKLAFCTLRIEDRKAGLNDRIWGGARYILGSLGLSAITPLPLTDHGHECRQCVGSHRSSESDN